MKLKKHQKFKKYQVWKIIKELEYENLKRNENLCSKHFKKKF